MLRAPGAGREAAIRALQAAGLEVSMIKDDYANPTQWTAVHQNAEEYKEGSIRWQETENQSLKDAVHWAFLLLNSVTAKNPTANQRECAKKQSEYGMQLQEKQKAKFIYGVMEKPFRNYFEKAKKLEGPAGENLIIMLEQRF